MPGSGKTTLGRQLASSVPALRLSPDEWLDALGIDLHDEATRERLEVIFWVIAQDLLRLGQSVILESGFWLRSDRDQKRLGGHALGASVELHYLDVPTEELWRRLEQRWTVEWPGSATITRDQFDSWLPRFEPPDAEELASFDHPSRGS